MVADGSYFFLNGTATTEIYPLSLHDALPISLAFSGLLFVLLAFALSGASSLADDDSSTEPSVEESPEKIATAALRRVATNIQFHKDDTVRLVRLSKAVVRNEHLVHLKQFPKLDYLAILCPEVTDEGMANIVELIELDTLLLSKTGITDDTLGFLTDFYKLRRLYLGESNITDAGMEHLIGLQSLEVFSAPKTDLSDDGLLAISKLKNLTTLRLGDTQVTDAGLEHLSGLLHLNVLYLTNCRINGSGVEHLQPLAELEHLCLNATDVDDQAIEMLGKLTQLKQLELYGTRLTAEGVKQLQQLLPETQLHVDPAIRRVVDPRAGDAKDLAAVFPAASTRAEEVMELLSPIVQRLGDEKTVPDFQRHVVPLLGRLGCNGRACHGSFQGQGGFRLSMFGYDFEMDLENLHERIDLRSEERRVGKECRSRWSPDH